jgi:hypothetical protein
MRLDNSARMNLPGSTSNNWTWRVGGPGVWETLTAEATALRGLIETYDRLPEELKAAAGEAEEAPEVLADGAGVGAE